MASRELSPQELRKALRGGVVALDIEDILRLLPHRPPVLLVDRVVSLVPRQHAVGIKLLTGNEYGLSRRRHGFVFPAPMALDALAQLAALVIVYPEDGKLEKNPKGPWGTLAGVQSLTVYREFVSPEAIHLHVSLLKPFPPYFHFEGEATVGGKPYVHATFDL